MPSSSSRVLTLGSIRSTPSRHPHREHQCGDHEEREDFSAAAFFRNVRRLRGRLDPHKSRGRRLQPEKIDAIVDRLNVFLHAIDFIAIAQGLIVFRTERRSAGA